MIDRLSEFCTYIGRNSEQIPNYGECHRCGEPISTATAEATVNQVISRHRRRAGGDARVAAPAAGAVLRLSRARNPSHSDSGITQQRGWEA